MRHLRHIFAPLLLAALAACATTPSTDPVEAQVSSLMARAAAAEPAVTARLKALAEAEGGTLVKLQYRLKTKKSATRKLNKELAEAPGTEPADIVLQDMLRYTMQVEDAPPGRYVQTVATTLATLEAEGHKVRLVKNYWPAGDNYSGVNSVLETPDGLPWELQFHTPASLKVQADTRPHYEELRKQTTPADRKRELFDQMTAAWDTVKIPKTVLDEKNLHPEEQIRNRKRP